MNFTAANRFGVSAILDSAFCFCDKELGQAGDNDAARNGQGIEGRASFFLYAISAGDNNPNRQ